MRKEQSLKLDRVLGRFIFSLLLDFDDDIRDICATSNESYVATYTRSPVSNPGFQERSNPKTLNMI